MKFEMIGYLQHIVAQSLKVNSLRSRSPPEVIVTLLKIRRFKPHHSSTRTPLHHHLIDELSVVAHKDLIFMTTPLTFLGRRFYILDSFSTRRGIMINNFSELQHLV